MTAYYKQGVVVVLHAFQEECPSVLAMSNRATMTDILMLLYRNCPIQIQIHILNNAD